MNRFLREFFNYTRQEKRSLTILLVFMLLSILFRVLHPYLITASLRKDERLIEESMAYAQSFKRINEAERKNYSVEDESIQVYYPKFFFDPNKTGMDSLLILGFSSFSAENLIRYRNAGGRFYKKEDLLKIYGINQDLLKELENWILVSLPENEPLKNSPDLKENIANREIMDINQINYPGLLELIPRHPGLASRIIRYRELLGGYHNFEQLFEVYEMNDSLAEVLKNQLRIDTGQIRRLSLNHSDFGELIRHPYLEKPDVNLIIKYREFKSGKGSLNEFQHLGILNDSILRLILPYLKE